MLLIVRGGGCTSDMLSNAGKYAHFLDELHTVRKEGHQRPQRVLPVPVAQSLSKAICFGKHHVLLVALISTTVL